jgi:hypothetical protein
MQLKPLFLMALLAGVLLSGPAAAQALTPMHKTGNTPSDVKGFRLTVGNPYKTVMTFKAIPMDPQFKVALTDAQTSPAEFRLVPGASRPVIVTFRIDPKLKERTIAVCVLPENIEGPVQPRVCGTYTGVMLAGARVGG